MTELFSIWGGYVGWRAVTGESHASDAIFDGHFWDSPVFETTEEAEKAFYRVARRAFLRKVLKKFGIHLAF
jgi:hypothetical protein